MDLEPKENSDLLAVYKKDGTCGAVIARGEESVVHKPKEMKRRPPDGGARAYMVLVASFLTNGLLFGVINSYGVIYKHLQKQLEDQGVQNSDARASLVGALAMGTTFFLSPLSGVLTSFMGLRMTAVLGGALATAGLLASSFVTDQVDALCFTYGFLYGLGASLAYTPSLAILGHYFDAYLGRVNGVVTIGSSVFTVIMPIVMKYMIENHGLDWMFKVLALFSFGLALCGLLFKPIALLDLPLREDKGFKSVLKTIVNVDIWKNTKYRLWALSIPVALFGYFVPYVHMSKFIEVTFQDSNCKAENGCSDKTNIPLQCIAVTSGIGRLVFGYLADRPGMDRILLQQISFYVIGCLTILLPFVSSFGLLLAVSLGIGLFDGAFISLIGPIAFELCGSRYAAQAIGCMLGLAATPLSVGPPVAGYLYNINKSYRLPFVLAGTSPIVGATLMFTIRFHRRGSKTEHVASTENGTVDLEKPSTPAPREDHNHAHQTAAL